jgi:Glyoxalase/Bleomycin resistance protein/Dioxygenase superfamily.
MMKIGCLDHVTINIKNLDKTIFFYGAILGLERLPDVDMGDHILRYYKISDYEKLELTEYKFETRYDKNRNAMDMGTIRHIAFLVDNAYEVEAKLNEFGYKFHVPVSYNALLNFTGGLVLDPNGVELEFLHQGK